MQTVFSIRVQPQPQPHVDLGLSVPTVVPHPHILERFWERVADLTSRYHDPGRGWIGGPEVRQWNAQNRHACSKCLNSKTGRVCIIDEDHPSCRACRHIKIGCDRKTQFVFDMTKAEFFPAWGQFLAVFQHKEPGSARRHGRGKRNNEHREEVAQLKAEVQIHAERVNDLETQLLLAKLELSKTKDAGSKTVDSLTSNLQSITQLLENLNGRTESEELIEHVKDAMSSLVRTIDELSNFVNRRNGDD
ncbi:hypothetical protein C8R44DRAFT_805131 [Mycena epipterygia]|nr:hypothetical protein C8R44DRAFT_805131 [Mycena epipterygia]